MIRSTIRQYYVLTAMSRFATSFVMAVYVTFLLSKGLNLFEVNLVNFVFFTTLFVFEIPTGAFADVFGRKASFIVSCVLYAIGMFIYAVSASLPGFLLAEVSCGIGATFASGAFQAWLVDKLRHHNYTGSLTPIFAREQQIATGMGILGALIGAALADVALALPWIIGGVIKLMTAIMALFWIKEEYFVRQKLSFKMGLQSMKDVTRSSITYGLYNKAVRFILVLGLIQFVAVQAPNMQWQPFFSQFLENKTGLGVMWAGMSISLMAGAALAIPFVRKIKSEKRSLIIVQVLTGLGIACATIWHSFPIAVTIFLLHEVTRGMFKPLKDVYLHDNIPSKERATIISFESIAHHLGGMIGLVVSGLIAEHFGIPMAWMIMGSVLIVSTLLVARNGWQK